MSEGELLEICLRYVRSSLGAAPAPLARTIACSLPLQVLQAHITQKRIVATYCRLPVRGREAKSAAIAKMQSAGRFSRVSMARGVHTRGHRLLCASLSARCLYRGPQAVVNIERASATD